MARPAASLFDHVVLCVLTNPTKTGRHPLTERLALLANMVSGLTNVTVDSSAGQLLLAAAVATAAGPFRRYVSPT